MEVLNSSPSKLKHRTFRAVFELPADKKESKRTKHRPPRFYRNPIFLAQEWQKALSNGDCSRPADLARKLGFPVPV